MFYIKSRDVKGQSHQRWMYKTEESPVDNSSSSWMILNSSPKVRGVFSHISVKFYLNQLITDKHKHLIIVVNIKSLLRCVKCRLLVNVSNVTTLFTYHI